MPAAAHARKSHYLKVRDRASYAYALVSAAVGLDVQSGIIRSARVALGGVGTVPWRVPAVEKALVGKPATEETFRAAAALAHQDAPEARTRLEDLAAADRSPRVQDLARRLLRDADATVSLPPLPGSASLNPRAN